MSIDISWYEFEGPYEYTEDLNDESGVYVVLDITDYNVIDVGQSDEVESRVEYHDRKDCWSRNSSKGVVYAVLYCDDPDKTEIEETIRDLYNPPCGDR